MAQTIADQKSMIDGESKGAVSQKGPETVGWLRAMVVACCVMLLPVSAWANHDPDLNDDGVVNILDVSLAGSCFGQDPTTNAQCAVADLNHDNAIDQTDINILSSSFGKTFPTLGSLEPAQLTIMVGDRGTVTVSVRDSPVNEDTSVSLESNDSSIVQVPTQVVILSGEASATFPVTGVVAGGPITIRATLNGSSATTEITVVSQRPPPTIAGPLTAGATEVGGTGIANALVDVFVNNAQAGMGIIGANGQFEVVVSALQSGDLVQATQTVNGVTSQLSAGVTVQPIPSAPIITPPLVEGMTDIRGTGETGATVDIFINSASTATGTVEANGTFAIQVTALVAGQEVTATQTVAGVPSTPSAPLTVVMMPAPPIITTPIVEGTQAVAGTGVISATVEVLVDGNAVGTTTVNASGTWSLALASALVAGQEVQAKQTVNGITSALSSSVTVVESPPPPVVTEPVVAGSTMIAGTGSNGATVEVFVDSVSVGTVGVNTVGIWEIQVPTTLVAGQAIEASQAVAGITSPLSDPVTVVSPPKPPIVDSPLITGETAVSGMGNPGATAEVLVNSTSVGTTLVDMSGAWTLALMNPLQTGQVVTAIQAVAGVPSILSQPVTAVEPPPAPAVDSPLIDGDMEIRGTGLAGASIEVFVDSASVGTTNVNTNNTWALMVDPALEIGQVVTAIQTVAGIPSPLSDPVTVQEVALNEIEIVPFPTANVEQGQSLQFTAKGTFSNGTVEDPLTNVLWNSDNPTVASIDPNGLVTGNSGGIAKIMASRDGVDSPETTLTVSQTGATITNFTPKSSPIGESITINGTNLSPSTPGALAVTLAQQGGGRIDAPITTSNDTTIIFTVPTGAHTGNLAVTIDQQPVPVPPPPTLTIVASSNYSLSVEPATADLIQGQTVSYKVSLDSNTGFTQLAPLEVSGLPSGVTAEITPQQISAGQTALLTLTAPAAQPQGSSTLTILAKATVDGIDLEETGNATLNIQPVTTSFLGRTVVSDTLQTPLAGVTITMLGKDDTGANTGCVGQTVSDLAGNFSLTNLPIECVGDQLIRYDGNTAITPPGKYAGVDLIYTIQADQVTVSPVLVHLPRIDNAETVCVIQNAGQDQNFTFQTIPNLSITVYAGTIFTPGPAPLPQVCPVGQFPLTAVDVPVDRLPEEMPPSTQTIEPFIVAFQPANATASMPVAVSFPNTLNVPPGTSMDLSTLDPTLGTMVVYGIGTVSNDGRQIVPDLNPATPGKRFGLVHFDWHGPRNPENPENPCTQCPCPTGGNPVDVASGVKVINVTDIAINGPRGPISIQRTMRTFSNQAGPFGIGTNHNYGFRLNTNAPQNATIVRLIMPDGNQFPFTKNSDGTLTNTTVPSLRGAVMTVAANGEASLRWKEGAVFVFVPGNVVLGSVLESITDRNGNQVNLVRNPSGPSQITEIIDPVGRKLLLSYDGADRILSVTDPIGRNVGYTYNAQGRLETVTDAENGLTQYVYDTQGRLTQVTDARGVVIAKNTYDNSGRIIKQVLADGGEFDFSYVLMNPLVPNSPVLESIVTDPLGQTTTYRFNAQGNLVNVTDHLGQVRVYEREPGTNQLMAITGTGSCAACGNVGGGDVSFTYDEQGNVSSRTDALGNTARFTYEAVFNKVTSITDAFGDAVIFKYDGFGDLLSRTDKNGNTTIFKYNQFGQVIQRTDPLNHSTTFDYDEFGNLIAVTDALGHVLQTQYDEISRSVESIDALGRNTKTAYDKLGRVVGVTDAKGNMTQTKYDEVGNRIKVTDARENTVSFTYDGLNRLKTRTDSRGNVDSRNYELNGNLTEFIDRRGQRSLFTYDELNHLITETYQDGSLVQRTYDAHTRLKQIDDTDGGTFRFEYDVAGRLENSIGPYGTVQYSRDKLGRVSQRQVVGQPQVSYTYDPTGNLRTATMPQAGITNSYDARNQLIRQERPNGVISDYSYDSVGQLLTLNHSNGAQILEEQTYTYDPVGNRTSKSSINAQALGTQSSIRQYATDSNLLLQRDSVSYTHDSNGNRLAENGPNGIAIYNWDARNRLQSIQGPSKATTFSYDFSGNLIALNAGFESQQMVLDEISNVVFQNTSNGNQFSALTGQTIDQHLGVVRGNGQVEYGLTDAINSTVMTTNSDGNPLEQFQYEPFGKTTVNGSNYPFQFTGRVPVEDDILYYRARYYDTRVKRFISQDPIDVRLKESNLYRYVGNSPINFNDPAGLSPTPPSQNRNAPPGLSGCDVKRWRYVFCVDACTRFCLIPFICDRLCDTRCRLNLGDCDKKNPCKPACG